MGGRNTQTCLTTSAKGLALAHKDDHYETRPDIFKSIQKETGLFFDLDICATDDNTMCMYYIDEEQDVLSRIDDFHWQYHQPRDAIWCNPPRSKNGKFVNFVYDILWERHNLNVVMLLCWNDLGNKYGKKLLSHILNGDFEVIDNYGKIKFYKNGKESEYPSRLTYFSLWFKSKP